MNEIERETIILNSTWEMIDDMVNWAMFAKHGTQQVIVRFQTAQHRSLFGILLADFLSDIHAFKGQAPPLGLLPPPPNARPSDLTFLFHLRQVYATRQLGDDVSELKDVVEAFAEWLEVDFVAPQVNLSVIGIVADVRISRIRYIKMCGDIAKHNLARLSTNVGHLKRLSTQHRPLDTWRGFCCHHQSVRVAEHSATNRARRDHP